LLEDSEFLLYSWNCDTNLTRSQNDRISHQFLGKRALEFIRERRSDTLVLKLQRQWRPLSELQLLENTESLFGLINGLSAAILIIHNGLHQPLKLSLQLYGLLHHHPWIRLQHPWLCHVLMNDDDPNGSDTPQKPSTFTTTNNPRSLYVLKIENFGSGNGEAENIRGGSTMFHLLFFLFSISSLRIASLF